MKDPLVIGTACDDPTAPPPVLLPYQQRWIVDSSPLKVAEKSRRVGLTWAEAADNVLTAARAGGSNVFYISASQDMALEYVEACAMWAKAYDLAAEEIEEGIFVDSDGREIKMFKVDFPKSGKRIVALSSRPANLRGKQGVVVIDEAAFAPDLAGIIKAAMAMLMWGDVVRIISTHNGDANLFNDLLGEIRAGKRGGSVHCITFADAVADGLYRRVCLRRGKPWTQQAEDTWVADVRRFYGDDAAEELDVIPAQGGGAYLPLALIEARMTGDAPIVRKRWDAAFSLLPEPIRAAEVAAWCEDMLASILATLDKSCAHALGEDFARVGDLTVATVLEESARLVSRPVLAVELANCPFSQQQQILTYIAERLPRFRKGAFDANGNGAQVAEYMADAFGHDRIIQVKLSDRFYTDNMPAFKAHLEDATLDALPRDAQWRDDLRAVQKINGIPKIGKPHTQTGDGQKLQRHGDGAISLFLADFAMHSELAGVCTGLETPSSFAADDDDDAYGAHRMRMF